MKTPRFRTLLNQTGFLVAFLLIAGSAHAALTAKQIQTFNSDSYQSAATAKPSGNASVITPILNGPSSGSCEQEACKIITCNFQSDIDAVKKACGGTASGGSCVREVCNRDGCATQSEMLHAVEACKAKEKDKGASSNNGAHNSYLPVHASGDCVSAVCSRIGCAFASDTESIARACQHASGSCVQSVCDQTGCTFKSDALQAIKSCDSSRQID